MSRRVVVVAPARFACSSSSALVPGVQGEGLSLTWTTPPEGGASLKRRQRQRWQLERHIRCGPPLTACGGGVTKDTDVIVLRPPRAAIRQIDAYAERHLTRFEAITEAARMLRSSKARKS